MFLPLERSNAMSLTISSAPRAAVSTSHSLPYAHLPKRALVDNIAVTLKPSLWENGMPPFPSHKPSGTLTVEAGGLADQIPSRMAVKKLEREGKVVEVDWEKWRKQMTITEMSRLR